MARVTLDNIRKVYGGDRADVAVHGMSVTIEHGEFVVLVGPSGCGKSTTLRMIAGLESASGGRLLIDDREVGDVPPGDRDVAMVFQNYALYPHMSVYDNLAFGLKMRRVPKEEADDRVRRAAALLGIEAVLERRPKQLSGGQRQRAALGRAIVRDPQVFLFDEPLSNLDAKLRVRMRAEISDLHRRLGATMIYVTHDQTEAMTMGDRIVVMEGGHVRQVDTPLGLYERPANRFVAGFIGSPSMNFVEGRIVRENGWWFRAGDGAFDLQLDALPGPDPAALAERSIVLGIRPEHIHLSDTARAEAPLAEATLRIERAERMGNETVLHARAGAHEITARVAPDAPLEPDATVRLAFDLARLHFFDPETGETLTPGG